MSEKWKEIGERVRPGNWPMLAWAIVGLVLLSIACTVIVGIELYDITGQPMRFNTR